MGELIVYQSLSCPSVVPPSVHPSTFSCIFSSETTGPIKLKFNTDTPQDAGTKVCSNGPGHMTKMPTTPIYGKNPLKSSSPDQKAYDLDTWYVAFGVLGLPNLFK